MASLTMMNRFKTTTSHFLRTSWIKSSRQPKKCSLLEKYLRATQTEQMRQSKAYLPLNKELWLSAKTQVSLEIPISSSS